MRTRSGMRAGFTVGACAVLCLAVVGSSAQPGQPCYYLQRSGGTTGGFCQVGQTVCDIGYSQSNDTGCGNAGPLKSGFNRKCYIIEGSVLTSDCQTEVPAGWVQVGCSSSGVCCFAGSLREQSGNHGTMSKPQGGTCGC